MSKYNKLIVAIVGALVTTAGVAFGTDFSDLTAPLVSLITTALTAFGVFQVANTGE